MKLGWILAVVVELGGVLAILLGLFTRPVGLVLAVWCLATALIAHTNFADRNQEIHFLKNMAMMGRVSLCRGVWSPRLESRRKVVPPRSVVDRAHRAHALAIIAPDPVFEYFDEIEGECSCYSAAEPLADEQQQQQIGGARPESARFAHCLASRRESAS